MGNKCGHINGAHVTCTALHGHHIYVNVKRRTEFWCQLWFPTQSIEVVKEYCNYCYNRFNLKKNKTRFCHSTTIL